MPKLIFTLLLLSGFAHAGAIEQLNRFIQTKTLSSTFSQTNVTGKKTQTSKGQLAISRPDRFRWEYQQPDPQIIVGDGQYLWIYDEDLNQVSQKNQKATLGDTPAALLAGNNTVSKFYTLSEKPNRQGLEWLEAKPKTQDQGFATIRMGFADGDLKAMELTDFTGQQTSISFGSWNKAPAFSPKQFEFTPPKGADILRD